MIIDIKKGHMEKIDCIKCNKYKKFKNPKIYIFHKTLVVSLICNKCDVMVMMKKHSKKKNQWRYQKFLA